MAGSQKAAGLMTRTLIHTAATLHYIDGLPQIEVARRMEMSTASVSRLLARARDEGIVRFEVSPLEEVSDADDQLANAMGLRQLRAIETARQPALSIAVGALIREADLPPNPVISIGWGRAVQSVVSHGLPVIANAIVVPSTGGLNQTQAHFQINEFVRNAAEQIGGTAHLLYAPARPGPELFAQLLRDPQTAEVIRLWDRVDVAVTGVGNFPDTSAETSLGFTQSDAGRVAGDVVRQYFDKDGAPMTWPGQQFQLGMSRSQLARVPLAIGVCVGADKVDAAIGAAQSGMVNTLVTDIRTAQLIRKKLGLPG
ncbi:MAG: sugar-binding domain-containing protein [Pseudomonadota bacterium]